MPSPKLRRQIVSYPTREAPGTIVIDTPNTYLYYVLGNGQASATASASAATASAGPASQHDCAQGGMAGLASAGRDGRAPALSAALHGGRSV